MLHAHGGRISIAAAASLLIVAAGSTAAVAATTNVTVTEGNLGDWVQQAYEGATSLTPNQQFVPGPGTPPLGGGSLKMSLNTADNPDRVEAFRTAKYDTTPLANLPTLTYSTYVPANAGTPQQPAYLRLFVDTDGVAGADDTLTFYPANNGTPTPGTWQTWDARAVDARWTVDDGSTPTTLTAYLALPGNADATIVGQDGPPSQAGGGIALLVGGSTIFPQADGDHFINIIRIGTLATAPGSEEAITRYDLEPLQPIVSIGDAQVVEGNGGAALSFPVTVESPTARGVRVEYNTVRGTALPPGDYRAVLGAVTIPAGETTGTIVVQVVSDTIAEPTETLTLAGTAPGYGRMGRGTATGTILDDDPAVVPPPAPTPTVVIPVSADLKVKGSGHKAGKDDIVADARGKAAGAKVTLLRKTSSGSFKKIATAKLNSKGNHTFKKIKDKNGTEKTTYKVKVSSTDLTTKDKGRIDLS